MADLTQTPANVSLGSDAVIDRQSGIAGEAIDAGDTLYKATADGRMYKAKSDTAEHAAALGMAANSAAIGQPVAFAEGGTVNPGATVAIGESYFVSSNAGKWQPSADVGSTEFVTFMGIGISASAIKMGRLISAVAHA